VGIAQESDDLFPLQCSIIFVGMARIIGVSKASRSLFNWLFACFDPFLVFVE
jgi:hypothetical protein